MPESIWTAEQCARLLAKPKKTPNGWKACCPAHEDSNPSLFLADGQDGLALVCYAGCGYRAICDALQAKGAVTSNAQRGHSLDIPTEHFQLGAYSSHWDYRDTAGRIVMRVCRWQQPGGAKDIRPLLRTPDGWKWAHHPTPRPLYQLERLVNEPEASVIVVEGEKTATAAQKLYPEFIATTWPGGAQAMGQADWAPLHGREVILVPDCDTPGRKAMAWVTMHLKTIVRSIRTMDPAQFAKDLPPGWDLADALTEKRDVSTWLDHIADAPLSNRLDWARLDGMPLPEREWAIDHWIPMGHVTLLSGAGGTGKSLVAQALASCLAARREYLDLPSTARRVLFWACEDSHDELWRRQIAIAAWLSLSLGTFSDNLFVHSYDRDQVELAAIVDGQLAPTPQYLQLREQVADYKADVVILDNIARLYAGNENDRHQVTSFVAMLSALCAPTNAAIVLLGHTSKAIGSEYSGSTAWEGAVRTRLYLGRTMPGVAESADTPAEDGVRYLARRKANYSDQDVRKIHYLEGVMQAQGLDQGAPSDKTYRTADPFAQAAVVDAMRKLAGLGEVVTSSRSSDAYLPKVAERFGLLGGLPKWQFVKAVCQLQLDGTLKREQVGTYPNRTPKFGLVLSENSAQA
jgi:5S rRNA maturation endonuclease (ribonuclease M5)